MRSPARGSFSRPRSCSAPARSKSPAPITNSPPARTPSAAAAWSGRAGGVWPFSSGNQPRGAAAAARLLGMPAVIVMPADAPRPKRERTAALGAEVVLYDRARDDRQVIAREIAAERHAALVPPYDDPLVIAGQGTAGREIIEDLAALGLAPDVVAVTASGGGLTAGIALAVKARVPEARVYTAEPEGFDDHARSFKSGQSEKNATLTGTICDARLAQTPREPP